MALLPKVISSSAFICLSCKPLYGLLQAKLQLITHAYFEEKDFSQITILKVTFQCTCAENDAPCLSYRLYDMNIL